jgi:beta-N-acetylhexosaminidase
VLDTLPITQDPLREQRLNNMRGKAQMNREQLINCEKWQKISAQINQTYNHA